MRILFLFVLISLFYACIDTSGKQWEKNRVYLTDLNKDTLCVRIFIYTIDSCEYLYKFSGNELIHRGRCKYCQARLQQTIRKEVNNKGFSLY